MKLTSGLEATSSIVSEELPIIMLWYNFHVVAYASFITGPDTRRVRDLAVWNIHEWEMH